MKKGILFCFTLLLSIFLVGCQKNDSKVAIDVDGFDNAAKGVGFVSNDNIDKYSNNSDVYLGSRLAKSGSVEVELVVYDTAETAESVLEEHMKSFKNLKSTAASEKNETGENYHLYYLVSNNYYMRTVRVDNTLVFCKVLVTNMDKAIKLFDAIGY